MPYFNKILLLLDEADKRDEQKLKRDPAVILRRARMHLRKRWAGHQGSDGRSNMLLIAQAIERVEKCRLNMLLNNLKARVR